VILADLLAGIDEVVEQVIELAPFFVVVLVALAVIMVVLPIVPAFLVVVVFVLFGGIRDALPRWMAEAPASTS